MKIDFTQEEFRQLLDLVFLGDWVVSAHDESSDDTPYTQIRNKIYSHAKDFGLKDLMEYDKENDLYCETLAYEQSLFPIIDYYDEQVKLLDEDEYI